MIILSYNWFKEDKKMSKEILANLGTIVRGDDELDYNAPVRYDCSYEGYGLRMKSYGIPSDSIKDISESDIKNIVIIFNNRIVYDSKNKIYLPGIWEEVLDELYEKIPILVRQKEEKEQQILHCEKLFKKVVKPLFDSGKREINDRLKLKKYDEEDIYAGYNGKTYHHYEVIKDNIVVFHVLEPDCFKYKYEKYLPGNWEKELKLHLYKTEIEKKEKEEMRARENIKQLKKLR